MPFELKTCFFGHMIYNHTAACYTFHVLFYVWRHFIYVTLLWWLTYYDVFFFACCMHMSIAS